MTPGKYGYKIDQLKMMLEDELSEDKGGYGAHVTHWAGNAAPVNIDADALRMLIDYYEKNNGEE